MLLWLVNWSCFIYEMDQIGTFIDRGMNDVSNEKMHGKSIHSSILRWDLILGGKRRFI